MPQFEIRQDHGFGSPHEPYQLPGWLCAWLLLQEQLSLYFVVARTVQPFCLLSFELEHKCQHGGSKFLFSYWLLNVTNCGLCISILFCFKLEVSWKSSKTLVDKCAQSFRTLSPKTGVDTFLVRCAMLNFLLCAWFLLVPVLIFIR